MKEENTKMHNKKKRKKKNIKQRARMHKTKTQQKQHDLRGTNILAETTVRCNKNASVASDEVWSEPKMTPNGAMMVQMEPK